MEARRNLSNKLPFSTPFSAPFSAVALLVLAGMILLGDVFFQAPIPTESVPGVVPGVSNVEPEMVLVSSLVGMVQFAISISVWWVFISLAYVLLRNFRSEHFRKHLRLWPLLLVSGVLAVNQTFSAGKPILAVGILMPGSFLTRLLLWSEQAWLHRLFEPVFLLLLLGLELLANGSKQRVGKFRIAQLCFLVLLLFECGVLYLFPPQGVTLEFKLRGLSWLHFALAMIAQASLVVAISELRTQWSALILELPSSRVALRNGMIGAFALVSLALLLSVVGFFRSATKPQLGAHYYTWFPENWSHGYAAEEMVPKIEPVLGEYTIRDPLVFLQHEWWAKEAGLRYLILDWWPTRARLQRRIRDYLGFAESTLSDVKISLHYEFLDLRQIDKKAIPGEPSYVVTLTDARVEKLRDDLVMLAKDLMAKPYFLRINNRPVIFLYATRHVLGDVAGAIAYVRNEVRRETALELFLVADEAFYQVLFSDSKAGQRLGAVGEVNWERLRAFDGVTSYNPYETSRPLYGGEEGAELFLRDVHKLNRHWARVAAAANLLFIPTALPGYNDRGVRLVKDHYVVPRQIGKDWFLNLSLDSWVRPFLDRRAPLAAVTSWNEWNEGTAIEPTIISEPTTEDRSETTHSYSDEQFSEGYGCSMLEETRRFIEAP